MPRELFLEIKIIIITACTYFQLPFTQASEKIIRYPLEGGNYIISGVISYGSLRFPTVSFILHTIICFLTLPALWDTVSCRLATVAGPNVVHQFLFSFTSVNIYFVFFFSICVLCLLYLYLV